MADAQAHDAHFKENQWELNLSSSLPRHLPRGGPVTPGIKTEKFGSTFPIELRAIWCSCQRLDLKASGSKMPFEKFNTSALSPTFKAACVLPHQKQRWNWHGLDAFLLSGSKLYHAPGRRYMLRLNAAKKNWLKSRLCNWKGETLIFSKQKTMNRSIQSVLFSSSCVWFLWNFSLKTEFGKEKEGKRVIEKKKNERKLERKNIKTDKKENKAEHQKRWSLTLAEEYIVKINNSFADRYRVECKDGKVHKKIDASETKVRPSKLS